MRRLRHLSPGYESACLLLLLTTLLITGCARKPFGSAVEKDIRTNLEIGYTDFITTAETCNSSFDGEIIVNWKNALDNVAFSGFFQTMMPSYFRLAVLNPLGQPIFVAASDGKRFQSVDTVKHVFMTGSLRSYAVLHDISLVFFSGSWGLWLSGRPLPDAPSVIEIYTDKENRGTWFSITDAEKREDSREYILLDLTENKMLQRIILNDKGKTEATITYENWQQIDGCSQPLNISVSGLSFGAELQLKLSDIRRADLTAENFKIPIPPNYIRKLLP